MSIRPLARPTARAATLVILGLATACTPTLEVPDGGSLVARDRSITPPPGPPMVANPPPVTPYQIITFRGTAEGRRVFVTANGLNPEAVTLRGGGEFCIDVQVTNPGTYLFDVQAYGHDNQIGAPLAERISVTYDPSAPPIGASLLTCAGVHPSGCTGQIEICDDGIDNDCNNLRDMQDPACNPCQDDQFEDNDDYSAPAIQPDNYAGLMICPGDPDYYGLFLRRGERVSAEIAFPHAEGDLGLDLLGLPNGNSRPVLERSDTQLDIEAISYTATVTGVHMLSVHGSMSTANQYDLNIVLTAN